MNTLFLESNDIGLKPLLLEELNYSEIESLMEGKITDHVVKVINRYKNGLSNVDFNIRLNSARKMLKDLAKLDPEIKAERSAYIVRTITGAILKLSVGVAVSGLLGGIFGEAALLISGMVGSYSGMDASTGEITNLQKALKNSIESVDKRIEKEDDKEKLKHLRQYKKQLESSLKKIENL